MKQKKTVGTNIFPLLEQRFFQLRGWSTNIGSQATDVHLR